MAREGFPTREDQIARRRERALSGSFRIRNAGGDPVFSIFEVSSGSGRTYQVQIRALDTRENSCTCPDYQANLLGTCKHIEAALVRIRERLGPRALAAARPSRPQVYLAHGDEVEVRLVRPEGFAGPTAELLDRYFDDGGAFRGDGESDLPAFLAAADSEEGGAVQIADEVRGFDARLKENREDRRLLEWYLGRVRRGDRSFDLLSRPLYPFQVQGLLHLAFNRRSLLADEMGLGKTVQAVAAALLLKDIRGVRRALVVCPASLKHQWAREIARFCSLPVTVVEGGAARRRRLYDAPTFFTVVNYEAVLRDGPALERLRPDLVILDEAQRIRNWKAKTADAVKAIPSKYAFVLTGTPLENRLDDLYSVFQFIDPRILGPLWRFNERHFELERRPSGAVKILGVKNLDDLRRRIAPKVLRRRKEEVVTDLPDRVENHYFVEMTPEQRAPYEEYRATAVQLAAAADKKPLTPAQERILLQSLVKMRLLCDALELHDPDLPDEVRARSCPKARELETILAEQVVEGGRKALVFSQWERMVDVAARVVERMGLTWVKLAGSVPQVKRGALLDRFREDPELKVFLSTDAGSVGLNLQAANLVVNLDVPWNPAVLDQRVGRSHRIGQREVVNVVNLVTRDSLEERVLEALETKRDLFQGVFGEEGEAPDQVRLGERGALVHRLREVFGMTPLEVPAPRPAAATAPPRPRDEAPAEELADLLQVRIPRRVLLVATSPFAFARGKILVVVQGDPRELGPTVQAALEEVAERFGLPQAPVCAVFDREGYANLLALAGGAAGAAEAYRAPNFTEGRGT